MKLALVSKNVGHMSKRLRLIATKAQPSTPIISAKMITKTIWLYRMKSLKYMISILAVGKWKLCLHNVIKKIDGNSDMNQ